MFEDEEPPSPPEEEEIPTGLVRAPSGSRSRDRSFSPSPSRERDRSPVSRRVVARKAEEEKEESEVPARGAEESPERVPSPEEPELDMPTDPAAIAAKMRFGLWQAAEELKEFERFKMLPEAAELWGSKTHLLADGDNSLWATDGEFLRGLPISSSRLEEVTPKPRELVTALDAAIPRPTHHCKLSKKYVPASGAYPGRSELGMKLVKVVLPKMFELSQKLALAVQFLRNSLLQAEDLHWLEERESRERAVDALATLANAISQLALVQMRYCDEQSKAICTMAAEIPVERAMFATPVELDADRGRELFFEELEEKRRVAQRAQQEERQLAGYGRQRGRGRGFPRARGSSRVRGRRYGRGRPSFPPRQDFRPRGGRGRPPPRRPYRPLRRRN